MTFAGLSAVRRHRSPVPVLNLLLLAIVALTLLQGLVRIQSWAPLGLMNTWTFTDLLINYQAGFVRRGALGEIIFRLAQAGYTPEALAVVIAWALAGLNAVLLARCLHRYCSWDAMPALAVIVLSPALLLFSANDLAAFGRKDPILLLPLLVHLEVALRSRSRPEGIYLRGLGLLVLPVFVAASLVHEIVLLTLPLHGLIGASLAGDRPAWLRRGAIFLAMAAAVTPAWYVHGDTEIARAICRSWAQVGLVAECFRPPGGMGALALDLAYSMNLSRRVVSDFTALAHWSMLLTLVSAGLHTATLWLGVPPAVRRRAQLAAAGFLLLTMTLGWDWGRWISLAAFIYLAFAFHPGWRAEGDIDPPAATRTPRLKFFCLILVAANLLLTVPHCCAGLQPVLSGPAIRALEWLN